MAAKEFTDAKANTPNMVGNKLAEEILSGKLPEEVNSCLLGMNHV